MADAAAGDSDVECFEVKEENPAQQLQSVVDSNANASRHHNMLPAAVKVQLHELSSENSVLKARLRSTAQELKNTRELCQRLSVQAGRHGPKSRSSSASGTTVSRDAAAQTKDIRGLRPLSAAARGAGTVVASLTSTTTAVQTNVCGKDCIVVNADGKDAHIAAAVASPGNDEVRRLKAEVLRSHAECASLHHAIQIMKASGSPMRSRGADAAEKVMFPDSHGDAVEFASADAAAKEGHDIAKASHLAAMERIATLTEALKQANNTIGELEREVARAKSDAVDMPVSRRGRDVAASATKFNKGTITDDAQLDVRLPGRAAVSAPADDVPTRISKSSALENALAITRAQLSEALDELSTLKGAGTAGNAGGRAAVAVPTASIGVSADLSQPLAEMFRAHGLTMDLDTVEELLSVRTRHLDLVRHTRELETKALQTTNSAAVRELSQDLETARKELVSAHQHIDELQYALDLEKRERFNPQHLLQRYGATDNSPERERLVVSDDAQKQAAAEIAFLCDTLAATKADAESLRSQLEQASIERDSAVHSFRELKAKTEVVLQGCQEITEATRADADEAITRLTHSVHQKDTEIFSLRGQLAAVQRDLEKSNKSLSASQKEAEQMKQRVATVQSAMSKLREDSNAQAAQLREVRAQLAAQHASALSSPRASTAGGPTPRGPRGAGQQASNRKVASPVSGGRRSEHDASANVSSIQALQQALDERGPEVDAARRLGDFGSPSTTLSRSRSGSPQVAGTPSRRRMAPRSVVVSTPRGAGADGSAAAPAATDMAYEELKAEYEELRACFLQLAAMAPNAMTAREVTDALTSAFEAQKERCGAVERELRKRTTTMQALKKELTTTREQYAELEKRVSQATALENRIAGLNRTIDKMKRAAAQALAERTESDERFKLRISDLEEELEKTREALSTARDELREGRELMLSLIGEDREALAVVAPEAASAATGSQRAPETTTVGTGSVAAAPAAAASTKDSQAGDAAGDESRADSSA